MDEITNEEAQEKGIPNWILIGIITLLAVAIVVGGVVGKREMYSPTVPGREAPDFTMRDMKGNLVRLSNYRGKVVFINFWATWCKPCRAEMPSMESLYEDMKARGEPFEILSVSIDSVGPEVIENFCREFKLTFPILHDRKGKIKKLYKTTGVPESFILDQNGFVAQKVIGAYNWASPSGRRVIEALLKEGPQSAESLQEEETVDAR